MTNQYSNYIFTTNTTKNICPSWTFGGYTWTCPAPHACATDPTSSRQFCCNNVDTVCWAPPIPCSADGSTFNCNGNGGASWCCLTNKFESPPFSSLFGSFQKISTDLAHSEKCTTLPGQINMCYGTKQDLVANISSNALNALFTSLEAANPTASTYAFDPWSLIALTQSITNSHLAPTSLSPTPHQSDTSNQPTPPSSIGAGTIAGIVIAAALVIVGLVAGIFFMRRRSKARHQQRPSQHAPPTQVDKKDIPTPDAQWHQHPTQIEASGEPVKFNIPAELPSSQTSYVYQELPAHQ